MSSATQKDVTARVRAYWEQRSCGTDVTTKEKYSIDYFEEIEDFRYRVEPFIHSFGQFTRAHGKRVLEVGVGAGTDFLQWVRAGAEAYGVDLTAEAIGNVRQRLDAYGLKAADLQNVNAEHLPYQDGMFDLVYSWGVIHHADDMEQLFREIYRVTRPGGTIKIMVYNYRSLYAWLMALRYGCGAEKADGGPCTTTRKATPQSSTVCQTFEKWWPRSGGQLSMRLWNQRIRPEARLSAVRRLVERFTPESMRWYLAFEFMKPFHAVKA